MWAFWETHREADGVTSLGSWMSKALDEVFHSHIPANSHLGFRQRLQWLSPESQGSSRAPPESHMRTLTVPVPCAGPVGSLLQASPLSRALAVPRMSHTAHPCFR